MATNWGDVFDSEIGEDMAGTDGDLDIQINKAQVREHARRRLYGGFLRNVSHRFVWRLVQGFEACWLNYLQYLLDSDTADLEQKKVAARHLELWEQKQSLGLIEETDIRERFSEIVEKKRDLVQNELDNILDSL